MKKFMPLSFHICCTKHLVSSNQLHIKEFISKYKDTVIKPLDGMGGTSIFRLKLQDPNLNVIMETITNHYSRKVMIQGYT